MKKQTEMVSVQVTWDAVFDSIERALERGDIKTALSMLKSQRGQILKGMAIAEKALAQKVAT